MPLNDEPQKLSELFTEGWKLFQNIQNGDESVADMQLKIGECINMMVRCTHMVNLLALFSSNEQIDELPTEDVRYLLLPAFLGDLYMKVVVSEDRKIAVNNAKVYFIDYLTRCKDYKVTSINIGKYFDNDDMKNSLDEMNRTRQEKIDRFKQSKEISGKIKVLLEGLVKSPDTVDDEQRRALYLDMLRLWINNAIDNIPHLRTELEILEHGEKIKQGKAKPPSPRENLKPMKPILITREAIRSQVLGAGYKSLPTMTEDEYFEKELQEGKIVLEYNKKTSVDEKYEKDSADEEDEGKLAKDRAWDEWKDTHRRGEGNKDKHG